MTRAAIRPPCWRRSSAPAAPSSAATRASTSSTATSTRELAGGDADALVPGMRAHLAGCPACREEHAALHALAGGGDPR